MSKQRIIQGIAVIKSRIARNREQGISMVIAAVLAMILTGAVLGGMEIHAREAFLSTQQSLAEEVLRFHVLANSDTEEDQALKLEVKEAVIAYMEASIGTEDSVRDTKVWVENQIDSITELCEYVIQEAGYEYTVRVTLDESYFPVKTYGDITFPEGEYEALKIEIGDAKGQNWWCCLYPNLCFVDTAYGVVSEEGKENLQEVLTVEEYEMITTTTEFEIEWFFFKW